MLTSKNIKQYFSTLEKCCSEMELTNSDQEVIALHDGMSQIIEKLREMHKAGNKVFFVGNGGSAGITSHMAIDYNKNGNIRATVLNDPSALTCLSNDYGYDYVFSKQIEFHAKKGDILIAISSSGKSQNILNSVSAAKEIGCLCITLSGFKEDNPLRGAGDYNFYVSSNEYGFVEVAHLALCHSILDFHCGIDPAG